VTACRRVDAHRCWLGLHVIPDLTRPPDDQSAVQRLVGVLVLLALFVAAGIRW
jgi:hypothetical protein